MQVPTSPAMLPDTDDDLDEQERLDAEDPLRHLRIAHTDQSDSVLIPVQPPTVHKQTVTLSYLTHLDRPDDLSLHTLDIALTVDASPGCGGIAWPAGEVCNISDSSALSLRDAGLTRPH